VDECESLMPFSVVGKEHSFLEYALILASYGFHVFPLRPNSKVPQISEFPRLATQDAEKIREWWSDFPCANVGISTSAFGCRGEFILALDEDNKNGKNGAETLENFRKAGFYLPPTFTQNTPTNGHHYLYLVNEPVRNSASSLGHGLDIRGMGGYIVGAGSVFEGVQYTAEAFQMIPMAPDWLKNKCLAVTENERAQDAKSNQKINPAINQERAVSQSIQYLLQEAPIAVQNNAGDTIAYRVAAKLKDFGIPFEMCFEQMVMHWNERCLPPWDLGDLERKVRNAYKYGQNEIGSASPEVVFGVIAPSLTGPVTSEEEISKSRFKFESLLDIEFGTSSSSLVEDWLDEGAVSITFGDTNCGKTFFTLDMALHVAMGKEWNGKQVKQGAVLYIAAEGGGGIKKRISAFKRAFHLESSDIPFRLLSSSIDLRNGADAPLLISEIKAEGARINGKFVLVVIDTLSRALSGGNENDSKDMGSLIKNLDRIRDATGAHVNVVHHSGKNQAQGARGHSNLKCAVDTEIEISMKGTVGSAKITKQRDLEFCRPIGFKFEIVELGTDSVGRPITSCVVRAVNLTVNEAFGKKVLPEGSVAKKSLDSLDTVLLQFSIPSFPEHLKLRNNEDAKIALISDWRKHFVEKYYPGKSRSTSNSAFTDAKLKLLSAQLIECQDNYVWRT
jgi:hypothetical protein